MVMPRRVVAVAAAACAALTAEGQPEVMHFRSRKWDELRVSVVELEDLQQPQLRTIDLVSLGAYFPTQSFGMSGMVLEGMYGQQALLSGNFQFEKREDSKEWAARSAPQDGAEMQTLVLGETCKCVFSGAAVYSRDGMGFLRLEFEPCTGCESGAARAAVVLAMEPVPERDAQVYRWMCAVHPRQDGLCAAAPPADAKDGVALKLGAVFEGSSEGEVQETHEATMLRMKSTCYDAVDYYMLGATLPVAEANWDSLMRLLDAEGGSVPWTDAEKQCCASVSVDRVVIETEAAEVASLEDDLVQGVRKVNFAEELKYVWVTKMVFTSGVVGAATVCGMFFSMWAKATCFTAGGLFGCLRRSLLAVIFSALSCALTYGSTWLLCLGASKLAIKLEADTGDALMAVPVMLSKACTPSAGAVLGATFVFWLWPHKSQAPVAENRQLVMGHYYE